MAPVEIIGKFDLSSYQLVQKLGQNWGGQPKDKA
jgi:hypothetical protein